MSRDRHVDTVKTYEVDVEVEGQVVETFTVTGKPVTPYAVGYGCAQVYPEGATVRVREVECSVASRAGHRSKQAR